MKRLNEHCESIQTEVFQGCLHHGIASISHGICVQWLKLVNTKVKGKNTLILEVICDPDTYLVFFFGEPGSLNDLNILEKSTIVGSILNGTMELRLPQELHYSINGTVCDYLYFLVDGIYPKWPIFISTISNASPGSKDKLFATYQEAVRKDIE